MYGVFVRILTERSQRKAFLQARGCIEDRLRLEDENEKQVSGHRVSVQAVWPSGLGEGQLTNDGQLWLSRGESCTPLSSLSLSLPFGDAL
jgi:hypothetical protein